MEEIPVYLFTGFMDSGKTSLILETLFENDFTEEDRGLIIACEDGDVEYDEEMEFYIVGSTEANSLQNKISNESPVGRALIGKVVGDCVDVETQAGDIQYKVLEIQRVS